MILVFSTLTAFNGISHERRKGFGNKSLKLYGNCNISQVVFLILKINFIKFTALNARRYLKYRLGRKKIINNISLTLVSKLNEVTFKITSFGSYLILK